MQNVEDVLANIRLHLKVFRKSAIAKIGTTLYYNKVFFAFVFFFQTILYSGSKVKKYMTMPNEENRRKSSL